jgi:hypothetical protein
MSDEGIYFHPSGVCESEFEWTNGTNGLPKRNGPGNVTGCGLLLNPANQLSIFFTLNGILLGKLYYKLRLNFT